MAQLIKANQLDVIDVLPANGRDFKYEELRNYVGGYIEILHLNANQTLVVNEEGKLLNLPYNTIATEVIRMAYQGCDDFIVGDALLCDRSQLK